MIQLSKENKPIGWWIPGDVEPEKGNHIIKSSILQVSSPLFLLNLDGQIAIGRGGRVVIGDISQSKQSESEGYPLLAYVPPLHPNNLGNPYFKKRHNLHYAYIAGAMANGITSVKMVEDMGRAGMIGFFGSAGLSIIQIKDAIDRLKHSMNNIPFGFNLIHSPNEPDLETAVVNLYLNEGISLVSAAAYMDLTLPIVLYRVKGIHRDEKGNIICPNKIIAKVSRVEVANKFFSPPPQKLLKQLIDSNEITKEEALFAGEIPMAEDLTAEADSGGHTDNRPAISLFPTILALRDEITQKYGYQEPICVGLGGGVATPYSTAAAFAMGAAYVLTGSINQSCVEAGTSEAVRYMLAEAGQADVTMAPAADMFELGVKVQVLKRGTMFPFRAGKLYDLYCRYNSLEDIPEKDKAILEKDFFRCSLQDEWENTKGFFAERDPKQITQAQRDLKHKMALVFRSYLGRSSTWANTGEPLRKIDYQIWCGPAIGAFNQWTKASFLEKPENRKVVTVAMNLLYGASVLTRVNFLRNQGVSLPDDIGQFSPMDLSRIHELLGA